MSQRTINLSLAVVEGMHLAGLVDEFMSMLNDSAETPDRGIERLTPTAYPDDAEASAEFSAATRGDLLDRRTADAAVVRQGLMPFLHTAGEDLVGDEVLEPRDVTIAVADVDAWLRTLTALRLVIATHLDITTDDDDHDPEDPRFGIYDWLGFRLDGLIAIADAYDGTAPDDRA
ncbi:hypothetical protein DC31_13500 [Microbacterium sp. CH12i]|uniref:DUF2017 family protein n=1 Tax=Microbacterium sp. CH12i TaxID=1479651 RepID=UPI000461478C|nr:DUF2017 family protein [Microbacterium sp. CH12i]KDA05516.1 hypothetical protein DC31_13500 [Microbacterium sp. CH12i]